MDPRLSIEREQLESRVRQLEQRDHLARSALAYWKGEAVNARQDANEWAGRAKDAEQSLANLRLWLWFGLIALGSVGVAAIGMRV